MLLILLVAAASPALAQPLPGEGRGPVQRSGPGPRLAPGRVQAGARVEPRIAIDAERAFAADAQAIGQWAAFRKWAAPDATMFVPQPTNAQAWLKDRGEPTRAVRWWPTASYVSCDGKMAVNTGGWRRPDASVGYFSTVWRQQDDGGWRWIVDGGDNLASARPQVSEPLTYRATCRKLRPGVDGTRRSAEPRGGGHSPDWTLLWGWQVTHAGARGFQTSILDGIRYRQVIAGTIAAPMPAPAQP